MWIRGANLYDIFLLASLTFLGFCPLNSALYIEFSKLAYSGTKIISEKLLFECLRKI